MQQLLTEDSKAALAAASRWEKVLTTEIWTGPVLLATILNYRVLAGTSISRYCFSCTRFFR